MCNAPRVCGVIDVGCPVLSPTEGPRAHRSLGTREGRRPSGEGAAVGEKVESDAINNEKITLFFARAAREPCQPLLRFCALSAFSTLISDCHRNLINRIRVVIFFLHPPLSPTRYTDRGTVYNYLCWTDNGLFSFFLVTSIFQSKRLENKGRCVL